MPSASVGLSKSRVMSGLQCHKRLWWTVHEPTAPELEPDEALQARFDDGHLVGKVARTYVPGGVLINLPHRAYDERVSATQDAARRGEPVIYEASFRADRVFVSVDILEREPSGAVVIEVKSATQVKEQYLADVAVQAHVVAESGMNVTRMEVMHLNRACAYPDLSNLFIRADVTEATRELLDTMPKVITDQLAMLEGLLPEVAVGEHCSKPYECPFIDRCWPTQPPHHISTLYAVGRRELVVLEEQGYTTIQDLPDDVQLRAIQDRHRRSVQSGQLIVEPGLRAALHDFKAPIAFLDFETVGLPIPVWNGCHPHDQVPVQFSCHVEDAGGGVTHHEWLAEGAGDPRPALAARVIRACEGARTVVAYNAGFERGCLMRMAEALPVLAGPLLGIADRLVDLLPVVRNHVYHPDFDGFGLKSVLPAMVPELSYDGFAINEGSVASQELKRLLFKEAELTPEAKAQLRSDLLRYCHQDTWGLVRLLRRFRELAPR